MIIGIDPHKVSHTATAVDPATNTAMSSLRVGASLAEVFYSRDSPTSQTRDGQVG